MASSRPPDSFMSLSEWETTTCLRSGVMTSPTAPNDPVGKFASRAFVVKVLAGSIAFSASSTASVAGQPWWKPAIASWSAFPAWLTAMAMRPSWLSTTFAGSPRGSPFSSGAVFASLRTAFAVPSFAGFSARLRSTTVMFESRLPATNA
jgi:hypothetical protein